MLFSSFDFFELLYYLIPAAALLFFAVSLIRYLSARRQNKRTPGRISPAQLRSRRLCLIVASVMAGAMLAVVLAFITLICMAVAFM